MIDSTKRSYVWTKGATPPHERILARVDHSDPNACWIWPGATSGKPGHLYGAITTGSRTDGSRRARQTHVVMFESVHGPVPDGLELHHRCEIKLCCNPAHLIPVTHQENTDIVSDEVRKMRSDYLALARSLRWAQ